MTDLLERAVAVARDLSPEHQDDMARVMLLLAEEAGGIAPLSEEERSMLPSLEQAARGEFATREEIAAIKSRYGLRGAS